MVMPHPRRVGIKPAWVRVKKPTKGMTVKVKEKVTVNGEPAGRSGGYPLATRLVENDNPLGKHPWLALAGLAGALLRFLRFNRPGGRRGRRSRLDAPSNLRRGSGEAPRSRRQKAGKGGLSHG
jgi:hypothetical protein